MCERLQVPLFKGRCRLRSPPFTHQHVGLRICAIPPANCRTRVQAAALVSDVGSCAEAVWFGQLGQSVAQAENQSPPTFTAAHAERSDSSAGLFPGCFFGIS
jgi:hypothetical protein